VANSGPRPALELAAPCAADSWRRSLGQPSPSRQHPAPLTVARPMGIGRLSARVARNKNAPRPTLETLAAHSVSPRVAASATVEGEERCSRDSGRPPAAAARPPPFPLPLFSSSFPSTRAPLPAHDGDDACPTEEMMAAPLPAPLPACASSHGERAAVKWLGGGARQAFPAGRGRSRLVLLRGASACRCAPRSSGTARPQKRRRSFAGTKAGNFSLPFLCTMAAPWLGLL
jgi:hypothetical protein